jgi:hypothetical protein
MPHPHKNQALAASFKQSRVFGGAEEDRTPDPLLAKQVLSQLSYSPGKCVVGLGRFELPTSPLSGVRSNQLSYRPTNRGRTGPQIVGEQAREAPGYRPGQNRLGPTAWLT